MPTLTMTAIELRALHDALAQYVENNACSDEVETQHALDVERAGERLLRRLDVLREELALEGFIEH